MATSIRKRKIVNRIKWTDEMENEVFEFCRQALITGKGFEKPTANEFYRNLLLSAPPETFAVVTLEKIVQHMKAIKTSYHVALNWRNQTGEGILAGDPNARDQIKREILKRCKQFDFIDEILGDRPQFNPPYIHHSDTGAESLSMSEERCDTVEENLSDLENELPSPSTSAHNISTDEQNVQLPGIDTETRKSTNPSEEHFSLKKRVKRSPIKSAVAALESAMKMRAEAEEKRLKWESECKQDELAQNREKVISQMNIEKAKLEFEKQKWEQEMQFKTNAAAQKFQLEKLRIEREAEMAVQKMNQEFELEKMRIAMKEKS